MKHQRSHGPPWIEVSTFLFGSCSLNKNLLDSEMWRLLISYWPTFHFSGYWSRYWLSNFQKEMGQWSSVSSLGPQGSRAFIEWKVSLKSRMWLTFSQCCTHAFLQLISIQIQGYHHLYDSFYLIWVTVISAIKVLSYFVRIYSTCFMTMEDVGWWVPLGMPKQQRNICSGGHLHMFVCKGP